MPTPANPEQQQGVAVGRQLVDECVKDHKVPVARPNSIVASLCDGAPLTEPTPFQSDERTFYARPKRSMDAQQTAVARVRRFVAGAVTALRAPPHRSGRWCFYGRDCRPHYVAAPFAITSHDQ